MKAPEDSVKRLADILMRAVVNTGVVTDENAEISVEIMKSELNEFLTGDKYKNERGSMLDGTIHEQYVLASVVASCVERIENA